MKKEARVVVFPRGKITEAKKTSEALDEEGIARERCASVAKRAEKLGFYEEKEVQFLLSRQDLASAEEAVADAEAQRKGVRPAGKHSRRGKYTF